MPAFVDSRAGGGGLESHAVRVLFASTQGAGHFGPLIPFIDACTRKGHEALIVGPPALKARGYEFRAGAAPPDELLGPLWGRMPSLPPAQGDLVVVGQIFAGLNVDAMLPTLERTIEEWKPDLVLREAAEFASAIAADRHGLRHVRVSAGVALFEEASLAVAAPALEERQPGIARRIVDSPYVSYLPAGVDPSPFPLTRYRHPATEVTPVPLPDWWPNDERPIVYVSFGSVAATFPPAAQIYAAALAAAAQLPVRVLLTLGGNELDLGDLPLERARRKLGVGAGRPRRSLGRRGTRGDRYDAECACGWLSASRRSALWRSALQRRSHCDLGSGRRGLGRPDPPANSARPRRRALPRHRSGDGGRDADVPIRRRLLRRLTKPRRRSSWGQLPG